MFGTNTMNREPEYQIDRKIKIYNNLNEKRPKGRFLCLYTSKTNLSQALIIVVSPRWT